MRGLSISISNQISGEYRESGDSGSVLAADYKKRVLADGGTYENNACLVAELNRLSTPYNYGDVVNAWVKRATALSYSIPAAGTLEVLQTQLGNIGSTTLAKMDVLHIYSPDSGTMDFFTLNAVAPTTFQAVLVNAPTTSVNGVLTDGSNYVDTGANPSNFSNYSLNDAQMSVYFSQNIHDNGGVNYPAGLISLNSSSLIMAPSPGVAGGRDYSAVNSVFFRNSTATNMNLGLKTIQRVDSSQLKTYSDGIQIANLTRSSTVLPDGNIFLGGISREGVFQQGRTNRFLADVFGSSLTTTEMATIGTAIEAIQGRSPLLLDQYAGSSAAYSLRNLSVDTNNVIRARRSSDNAELDFTSIQITDGTLTTWTGSGDGFVAIWYDQSVNNKDISSSTAAQQPKIVSSGSVLMDNGSPYILYDGNGSTGLLNSSSGLSNTNGSIFATYNSDSLVSGNLLVGVNGSSYIGIMSDGSISIPDQGSGVPSYYKNGSLISRTRDSLYDNYVINEDVLITVLNCSFDDGDWGTIRPYIYAANSFSAVVKAKEFIIYDSDQTTNAADIEGNINDNYSIY